MDYKSNKSEQFRLWLRSLDDEKIRQLIDLERFARLVVHHIDLLGDADQQSLRGLARASKKIQADYGNKS